MDSAIIIVSLLTTGFIGVWCMGLDDIVTSWMKTRRIEAEARLKEAEANRIDAETRRQKIEAETRRIEAEKWHDPGEDRIR